MAKEKVAVSFEVPAEIAQVVARSINWVVPTEEEVFFNDETKLYEFEDGKYTVEKELFAYSTLPEQVYNPLYDFENWAKNQAFQEKSGGVIDVLKGIRNEIEDKIAEILIDNGEGNVSAIGVTVRDGELAVDII